MIRKPLEWRMNTTGMSEAEILAARKHASTMEELIHQLEDHLATISRAAVWAHDRMERLEAVMRDIQWGGTDYYEGVGHCPSCKNNQDDGHRDNCALIAALKAGDEL